MNTAKTILRSFFISTLLLSIVPCVQAQFAQPQVELSGATGPVIVEVELARTPKEQQKGLMHRKQLAANTGMLFIYSRDSDHSFWMKNTYIALDMIFIDKHGAVVGFVENAEPLTTTSRRVHKPSRNVLEVNAGFVLRHGIAVGSKVIYRGIDGL